MQQPIPARPQAPNTTVGLTVNNQTAPMQNAPLGGSGGPSDMGIPTPEDIVNMTPQEFDAFKAKFGSVSQYLARQ